MQNKDVWVILNDEESLNADEIVLLGDKATISSARILRDSGEMIAPVTIARTGIMLYKAKELGPVAAHLPPEQVCRVRTKPEVLFDQATIDSCRSAPFTLGHPKDDVNLANYKELQKGFIEGLPEPDGSHLSGYVVVNDQATIKLVDSGVDQVSMGHASILVPADDAEADFDKTTIRCNHVALVRRGRAQTTRIGDSGEEIEIVDKAQLDLVEAQRDELKTKVETLTTKLADAESARLSDEEITKLVEERAAARLDLLTQIAKLGDEYVQMDFSGKTEMEIKRMVVAKLRDADMSDKSDDYVTGRFEIALEDCGEITLSDALSASLSAPEEKKEKKLSPREEALARRQARFNK
ncbi:putative prohead protease [Erwinia phage Farigoule]|nr:putative prohead protease [Erwinia phage Farigoule]